MTQFVFSMSQFRPANKNLFTPTVCQASSSCLRAVEHKDYDQSGKLVDEGTVIPHGAKAPFAFWLDRTPPHSVHNIDAVPIHLLRVELKTAPTSGALKSSG